MTDRLFVALWPSAEATAELDRALRPLRRDDTQIRWQPPHRWHVTVAFLGDRDRDREVERFRRIAPAAASPLRFSGSGNFGPILWVGVEARPWLAELARSAQTIHRCAERRFSAHLTVGRSRSPSGQRQIRSAAPELAGFRGVPWTPAELTLVRSTIGPKPEYEVIVRSPLTGDSR